MTSTFIAYWSFFSMSGREISENANIPVLLHRPSIMQFVKEVTLFLWMVDIIDFNWQVASGVVPKKVTFDLHKKLDSIPKHRRHISEAVCVLCQYNLYDAILQNKY